MIGSELDAAGVRDPLLRESYRRCRALNAKYGRTFFLATRLLAPQQRPAVHALYGFARRADDILDDFDFALTGAERGARLQQLAAALFDQMVDGAEGGDESLAAVVHTARRYGIAWQLFDDFLASMRMDLTVTDYPDRAALERYMYGSAEVIGLQLLPVLGTVCQREEAAPYAAALGKAFQLTNFLRDVDEDLARDRVYLPADELAAHGVDRDVLMWCRANRRTDARLRRALTEQHAITRGGVRLRRARHRAAGAAVAALRAGRIHAVLRDLGLHRRHRLRHLRPARDRRHLPSGACRRGGTCQSVARAADPREHLSMDRWQYLMVLGACLLLTAPLEWLGSGVYRHAGGSCWRSRRWRPCSSYGTSWRSRPMYGPTTRVMCPASSCRRSAARGAAVFPRDSAVRAAHLRRCRWRLDSSCARLRDRAGRWS